MNTIDDGLYYWERNSSLDDGYHGIPWPLTLASRVLPSGLPVTVSDIFITYELHRQHD